MEFLENTPKGFSNSAPSVTSIPKINLTVYNNTTVSVNGEVQSETNPYTYVPLYVKAATGYFQAWSSQVEIVCHDRKKQSFDLQYSYDLNDWYTLSTSYSSYNNLTAYIQLPPQGIIYFRGDNPGGFCTATRKIAIKGPTSSRLEVGGNMMSLISRENFHKTVLTAPYAFQYLFSSTDVVNDSENYRASNIYNLRHLVFPHTLSDYCCHSLFKYNTGVRYWPTGKIFGECNHYPTGCCQEMFKQCSGYMSDSYWSGLDFAETDTVGDYAFYGMFMESAIDNFKFSLIADALGSHSFARMFYNCKSIKRNGSSSMLMVGHYGPNSCEEMFAYSSINRLVYMSNYPKEPSFGSQCFAQMYANCPYLELGASGSVDYFGNNLKDDLGDFCFEYMFAYCPKIWLTQDEVDKMLPFTKLGVGCYEGMFKGCTKLTQAPNLPATVLKGQCYREMFQGCTKLNSIKAMFIDGTASQALQNWVQGVSSTGTFTRNSIATWTNEYAPSGWTIQTSSN